jgi:hypothetical protein
VLKRLVRSLTFYAFSTLNLLYAYRLLKREFVKLAETEKADNKFHYVAIRLARGEYNTMDLDAFEQMRFDFKFNDIASQYHAEAHFKD